jgi:nucleoside-diphosphate-sugar epimerase
LLEMSPLLRDTVRLVPNGDKHSLLISRSSWLERVSIRFLKQPAAIRVELDSLGDTVLQHCDGNYTVQQIVDMLASRFGKEAEPVLPRLVKFLQIVEMNGWIGWKY